MSKYKLTMAGINCDCKFTKESTHIPIVAEKLFDSISTNYCLVDRPSSMLGYHLCKDNHIKPIWLLILNRLKRTDL